MQPVRSNYQKSQVFVGFTRDMVNNDTVAKKPGEQHEIMDAYGCSVSFHKNG